VVMERQYRYPLGRVITEFPAGTLDTNEDLLHCAQALLEEPVEPGQLRLL